MGQERGRMGYFDRKDLWASLMATDDQWQFYKDKAGLWRWRRLSANRRIVGASTEGYADGMDCKANAIRNGYNPDKNMKPRPYPIDTNPQYRPPQGDSFIIRLLRALIAKFTRK